SAVESHVAEPMVATMVFAACTDHRYLDEGHSLDFANKAFELLDHIGWTHAGTILPSLVPNLVSATRAEESTSWRHPVDLPSLLDAAYSELDGWIAAGRARRREWTGHAALADVILDGEPTDIIDALAGHIRDGVPLDDLSSAVAYAAARRLLHFPVSNEFNDWNTVHHTFTYANAVDAA